MNGGVDAVDAFRRIEDAIQRYKVGSRTPSAAQLAWFMHNGLRMEDPELSDEVTQSICDGGGDWGVDGIVVGDQAREVLLLQSKHKDTPDHTEGNKDLAALVGARALFASKTTVDGLHQSRASAAFKALLTRVSVAQKIADGYTVRLIFVTNSPLNKDARDYLLPVEQESPGLLEVWDRERLSGLEARTRSPGLLPQPARLPIPDGSVSVELSDGTRIALAPVAAKALIALPGIADLSLFSLNVRFGAGNTRINRELDDAVQEKSEHEHFLAFHNGITLLTNSFSIDESTQSLELEGLAVVNGCQSLLAFSRRPADVSAGLRLPVRVVAIGKNRTLAEAITYKSNNQNPIDMRDQCSNDPIQRDLQAQFRSTYGGIAWYQIKVGEKAPTTAGEPIDNAHAAQLIMAFWLGRPWEAVRRVKLFDESYYAVFHRGISAHHVFLAHLAGVAVEGCRGQLSEALQASFSSVRYAIVYLVKKLVEEGEAGKRLLAGPESLLPARRAEVARELGALAAEAVESTKFFLEEKGRAAADAFDPKTVFKSQSGIRDLEGECILHFRRGVRRDPGIVFDPDRK